MTTCRCLKLWAAFACDLQDSWGRAVVPRARRGRAGRGDARIWSSSAKVACEIAPSGQDCVVLGMFDVLLLFEVCSLENSLCVLPLLPGFKEQIYDVYRYLPPATQVVLISATLPHEILEMTNKFMTDPIRILVKR